MLSIAAHVGELEANVHRILTTAGENMKKYKIKENKNQLGLRDLM